MANQCAGRFETDAAEDQMRNDGVPQIMQPHQWLVARERLAALAYDLDGFHQTGGLERLHPRTRRVTRAFWPSAPTNSGALTLAFFASSSSRMPASRSTAGAMSGVSLCFFCLTWCESLIHTGGGVGGTLQRGGGSH